MIIANETLFGMLNIGTRPTFKMNELAIETHIFDFSDNIYGQEIEILFFKRWRDERKFENQEQLVEQLKTDQTEIKAFFEI